MAETANLTTWLDVPNLTTPFLAITMSTDSPHNLKLLRKKQTGYWSIKKEAVDQIKGKTVLLHFRGYSGRKNIATIFMGTCKTIKEDGETAVGAPRYVITITSHWEEMGKTENRLATFCSGFKKGSGSPTVWADEITSAVGPTFQDQIQESRKLTPAARQARLDKAPKKPQKVKTFITAFERNPDVVVEVLLRANGICECCKKHAPFKRKGGGKEKGTPYLEVHHIQTLADGGDDTVENAEALCPNCHRTKHFGPLSELV
jgi:5-methylcytosine-specific restriction endonuclease McrA